MTVDTSTGVYLPEPVSDSRLDAAFHGLLVGVTLLPGELVRPAFQDTKPVVPNNNVNWIAYNIEDSEPDDNPQIQVGVYTRNSALKLSVFAYGPLSPEYLRAVVNGMTIKQNLEALMSQGLVYKKLDSSLTQMNELFNNQWYKRWHVSLLFGLHEQLTDSRILDILSSDPITIHNGGA